MSSAARGLRLFVFDSRRDRWFPLCGNDPAANRLCRMRTENFFCDWVRSDVVVSEITRIFMAFFMDESTHFLIEPSGLTKALANGAVLIDARPGDEFKRGHIPGAVPFSTYDVLVPNTSVDGMRTFAQNMGQRFSIAGVSNERQGIVYYDDTGKFARRELWVLEYLGHRQPRMRHAR